MSRLAVVAFFAALLIGCCLFPNSSTDDVGTAGHVQEVGPTGLTLEAPSDSAAALTISADALSKSVSIGFQKVEPQKLAELPAGVAAVSRIYELTPHGLELEKPVDLKMPHAAIRTTDIQVLRLADAVANTWQPILEGVVIGKNSVKLSIDHFSYQSNSFARSRRPVSSSPR